MGKNRIKLENHCSQTGKYFSPKKLLIVLFSLFIFTQTLFAEVSNTTITIDNARQTLYKKDPDSGNDIIVFEGNVSLSVQKDKTTSTITADRITYDRKTEMLCAEGNVSILTKGSGSGDDTATANSLLLNTSTMEAVFDGGRIVQKKSDAMNLNGSTLIVFSKTFGRSESNVIAFKNSSLTFCDDENPHWKINATRTWLLPGGEFAFFNALLFVGEIPVLYLPAFYYPKDELIFNPVFGMTKRKGVYNQNTFYFYGRKSSSSSSSSSTSSSSSSSSSSTSSEAATDAALKGIYNFMKPSTLKQQKREGLMLHNLDEDFTGNTTKYVKIMADWYQNLGYMAGVDGVLSPSQKYLTDLKFGLKLGFSNTLYENNGTYSFLDENGLKTIDDSYFLGLALPFRYSGNLSLTLSKPFSLTLSMPLYSDPYFNSDFNSRSESMDWISYLMGLVKDGEDDTSVSATSSFTWQLSGKYNPTIPDILKPYVSSLNTSFTSSLNISSLSTSDTNLTAIKKEAYSDAWKKYTPRRQFYYPSQVTPVNASASISGTIFQYSSTSSTKKSSKNVSFPVELSKPDELKTQKEIAAEEEKVRKLEEEKLAAENQNKENENQEIAEVLAEEEKDESTVEEISTDTLFEFNPELPALSKSTSSSSIAYGTTYKLTYSISPVYVTQFAYNSPNLKQSEDFEWSNIKATMFTFKSPASLNSNLSLLGSFINLTNGLSYSPVIQRHPYINVNEDKQREDESYEDYTKRKAKFGGYSESDAKSLVKADYTASTQTITSSNTLTIKPFLYSSRFSSSNIGVTSNFKLLRYELDTTKIQNENTDLSWEENLAQAFQTYTLDKIDLDSDDDNDKNDPEDFFTSNTVNMTLATSQKDDKIKESLSLSSVIWPLSPKYSGTLSLSFPYTTLSFGTAWVQTQKAKEAKYNEDGELKQSSQPEIWEWDPFTQSFNFSYKLLNSTLSFTESLSWDMEAGVEYDKENNWEKKDDLEFKNKFQSLKLSASWYGVSVAYVMSYALGADLAKEGNKIKGWVNRESKEFLPYSLSFSYSPGSKTLYSNGSNSIVAGFNTSIYVDMIKYTNSYFSFVPSITLKTKPVNVTFSSTSKNSVLYWYFHDDITTYQLGNNPVENIFLDLVRSYYFWDDSARKASGFKLKALSMTMSRDLHDWKFNMSLSVSPRLVSKKYRFDPYLTIGIVWNPMESIKTQIVDKYGEWTLN